jgi:hypothetical protein
MKFDDKYMTFNYKSHLRMDERKNFTFHKYLKCLKTIY